MSKLRYLFPLLLALLIVRISWAEGDLLDAEQAFQMAAAANGTDTIRVRWTIADGYYLYRSKFKFKSDTVGITFGEPRFPKGTIKKDEFLGNVEIYRGSVEVEIPITRSSNKATNLTITATSQGCADAGVCYPPHKQVREVILPEIKPLVQPAPGFGASDQLPALGNDQQAGVLEPDQAFQVSVGAIDSKSVTIHYEVTPHYYLYRGKLKFELDAAEGVTLGTPEIPPGEEKEDEFFGTIRVFHNSFDVRLPLLRNADAPATSVAIQLGYQGCAEAGICYPPMKKRIVADLPPANATTSNMPTTPATAPAAENKAPLSEQDRLARFLTEKPLWLSIGLFLLIGVGLTFTPCVFPMIPILSSIIIGQGKGITTRKAFILSLVYVEAMALTYALAAVAVALLGANLQAAFQNPWILSSFALIFVLLALSMFGFYELQMPASIQSKLSEISNRQGGGTLFGVGIMGVLSALIVGPCVTAPLMAALIVIGQAGDPVLGFSTIFAMGNGMGIPLLIIGTSAGKLLPRAGVWMDVVKAIFGVLILSVAIWMLGRILPLSITQLLWAMLFIISSIYMGAIEPVGEGASGWRKFWKGLGIVILIWGVMLLISVANLLRDDLDLRLGGQQALTAPTGHLTFKRVASEAELDAAIAAASAQGKPVMLDYYADWCVSCKEFEKYTFGNPEVQAVLTGAVLLQADVTANSDDDKALLKRYNLIGPPAILFFDRNGREQSRFRVVGFMPAQEFSQHARQALAP